MRRVLFVDDEPQILEGLRRMLRTQRVRWEMVFAAGGEQAVNELEAARFDVIVSDVRMPGIDGPRLLAYARERFPAVVRIALSGYTDLGGALRSAAVAHQFLAKPCDAGLLKEVVERACELGTSLADESIRCHAGAIAALPSRPRVFDRLTCLLDDPEATVPAVARLVEQDVALCAKLLQLLNSAFFGLPRRQLTDIETAVGYLGTSMLRRLTRSTGIFRALDDGGDLAGACFESLQRHAILSARIAARLFEDRRRSGEAFMAALLHDVGRILLADGLPDRQNRQTAASNVRQMRTPAQNGGSEGPTPAQVGAYLLGLWGLPESVVEAVGRRRCAVSAGADGFDLSAAVHLADLLAHEYGPPHACCAADPSPLDDAYVETLGVTARLPSWRTMARETAAMTENSESEAIGAARR